MGIAVFTLIGLGMSGFLYRNQRRPHVHAAVDNHSIWP